MSYGYSNIDNKNIAWFKNDATRKSLKCVKLSIGQLRGLSPFEINFSYPITAIAGKNGSGKSTILAMICCAYHNNSDGFIPSDRNIPYYTFKDFFTQTSDEIKVEGLAIEYSYLVTVRRKRNRSNSSKNTKNSSDKVAKTKTQILKKKKGGRWSDYGVRRFRNVIYSGTKRIVPPGERTADRSSSSKFKSTNISKQTEIQIIDAASKILSKEYTSLDLRVSNRKQLFVVTSAGKKYSGFNMGAGENAIFSILIELFNAGEGSLIVVDEIELGLHEEAQNRFIDQLKYICEKMKCQVVCTTHSSTIINALPPEGRIFLETFDDDTSVMYGISAEYATGKLSGIPQSELSIYVEDKVAASVITNILPQNLRERTAIINIGSDQAVLQHISAMLREKKDKCIAVLDGDKRKNNSASLVKVKNNLETSYDISDEDLNKWINDRLDYLPGDTPPESWLIKQAIQGCCKSLSEVWGTNEAQVSNLLKEALVKGTHNEFYHLTIKLSLPLDQIMSDLIRAVHDKLPEEFTHIYKKINTLLSK